MAITRNALTTLNTRNALTTLNRSLKPNTDTEGELLTYDQCFARVLRTALDDADKRGVVYTLENVADTVYTLFEPVQVDLLVGGACRVYYTKRNAGDVLDMLADIL